MNLQNLSDDDNYFLAKVSDAIRAADTKSCAKMVGFLDERQQELAKNVLHQQNYEHYMLYGGYAGASRKVLGVFPQFIDLSTEPALLFDTLEVITAKYRVSDQLTHRDFLGALMNLNIKRESVGDILVGEGYTVLFVMRPVMQIILEELVKVGRVGVRCENTLPEVLPLSEHFLEIKDTVSSLRLDCVVASVTNLSREKASTLIKQGLVTQNFECIVSCAHCVQEGDKLTLRGYGKFILAQVGGLSKKGRIQITCKKYL